MKIGDYLKECPKCKNRWFKKEELYALNKDSNMAVFVEYSYVCSKCGTVVHKSKGDE